MKRPIDFTFRMLLVLSLLLPMSSFADEKERQNESLNRDEKPQLLIAQLEQEIPQLMDEASIPGLSIAVIREGALLWEKGFGVKSVTTGEPVTPQTVFEAASLSKPVFSYAVMKMVERGELDLDRPLIEYASDEYLAENFLNGKIEDERFRKITARMVLSHSTGFPNWRGNNPLTIQFEPGAKFSYSGEGFGYLQKIVEKLAGLPLNEFVGREVFEPLGMIHSSYNWREDYEKATALPHNLLMEPEEKRRIESGHAAAHLHSTVSDYASFLMALLNHNGLKSATLDCMLTPQIVVDPDDSDRITWGLGIGLQHNRKTAAFWHWGDNTNFRCFFIAFPVQRTAVVYFTNSYHGLTVREELVKLAIGGDHPVMNSAILKQYGRVHSPWMQFLNALTHENVDAALATFRTLGKKYPATEIIPEYPMNGIGYFYLRKKRYQTAIRIFQLNTEIYPDSWNVYDSLAEAYLENGDTEPAIRNYQKSVELNPDNENARKIIQELKETRKLK